MLLSADTSLLNAPTQVGVCSADPESRFTRLDEAVSPGRPMTWPGAARTMSSNEDQVPPARHYVAPKVARASIRSITELG
jgi:hypothetical protein